ncbi:MAG: glycosyl hydrolase family 8 [Mariprofundaceae bacterium]|nr:glycosyl hydrolase family 8 [Mariprofundaceae bacterium]
MLAACSEQEPIAMKQSDWNVFKQRFITVEGRVMDDAQSYATHSEGQAYAMLLAVAFNDRRGFDQYWEWSRKHLQIRESDHFLAWLWSPESQQVADMNNATDGDLITAWALVRAAKKWGAPTYAEDAKVILADLKNLETIVGGYLLLLPGGKGFINQGVITVNPSYFVFPAYQELAAFDPDGNWGRLHADALKVLKQARFGKWQLPPDWLDISDAGVTLSAQRPPWFSYDGIRIPLHAVWGGIDLSTYEFNAFWQQFETIEGLMPDRVDLETDFIHFDDVFRAPQSINLLCVHMFHKTEEESQWPNLHWQDNTSYFDASLMLLSQLAWLEVDTRMSFQQPKQGVMQ